IRNVRLAVKNFLQAFSTRNPALIKVNGHADRRHRPYHFLDVSLKRHERAQTYGRRRGFTNQHASAEIKEEHEPQTHREIKNRPERRLHARESQTEPGVLLAKLPEALKLHVLFRVSFDHADPRETLLRHGREATHALLHFLESKVNLALVS